MNGNKRTHYVLFTTLFARCIDTVLANIEDYRLCYKYLPQNIKDIILRRLLSTPALYNFNRYPDEIISTLVHRETLEIDLSNLIVGKKVLQAITTCTKLQKLVVAKTVDVSPNDLAVTLKHFKYLIIFEMRHSKIVTDKVVETLCENCTLLKQINVSGCSYVADGSLYAIADHLEQLECLNISYTTITDDGIEKFVKGKYADKIRELMMDHCHEITEKSIIWIKESFPNSEILTFSNCPHVRDIEEFLSVYTSNVKHLHFNLEHLQIFKTPVV